jgi:hypothetical protein
MILEEEEENENNDRDRADRDDLAIQVRLRAFLDGAGDLLHPFVAGRGFDDGEDEEESENEPGDRAEHGKSDAGSKKGQS